MFPGHYLYEEQQSEQERRIQEAPSREGREAWPVFTPDPHNQKVVVEISYKFNEYTREFEEFEVYFGGKEVTRLVESFASEDLRAFRDMI